MIHNQLYHIRSENSQDYEGVYQLYCQIFRRNSEAELVNHLRKNNEIFCALVAIIEDTIIGHILFSPVRIASSPDGLKSLGLAPLGVLPLYQKQGIGSALVSQGLKDCEQQQQDLIVVLGYPDFYQRFGFKTALQSNLGLPYSVPEEAFMVKELTTGILTRCQGNVYYSSQFDLL